MEKKFVIFYRRLTSPDNLSLAIGISALAAISIWLLALNGHSFPRRLAQLVSASVVLFSILGISRWARNAWQHLECRLLMLVVAVALVFGFVGLGHEVGKGYYTDEGHYLHHAREINGGKPFTPSFVYPHFLYYLDAFALHEASLFRAPTSWIASLYGVSDPAVTEWLVLRLVGALMGSLTVVPVFLLGRRVMGNGAAVLASLLMIFAAPYQEGFQVNISDVPSAFFAAVCIGIVGRLLDEEKTKDYLLAGLAAGLAASTKYPAGTVAVAIIGIWIYHRFHQRNWRWGLLWAGLTSIAVFLALNPSLFVHTESALYGRRGLFFGVRQYGSGGWLGVMPSSNTLYYAERLVWTFGWLAPIIALAGFFGLPRDARRRLTQILPFPVVYLFLICSMNMVVLRNLFPVIPALAVVLGVLLAGVGALLRQRLSWPRLAVVALAVVVLAQPALATFRQTVGLVRPSTRDMMRGWMLRELPQGTGVLKEAYTPNFFPHQLKTIERRFAYRIPEERYQDPEFEYLLLAGPAFWRFFRPENKTPERTKWYENVFNNYELVHEIKGDPWRRGPLLRLYRLPQKHDE